MNKKRQLAEFLSKNINEDSFIDPEVAKKEILCLLVEFEEEIEGKDVDEKKGDGGSE